MDTLR